MIYEVCLKIKRSDCIEVSLCDEHGVSYMAPIKLQMGIQSRLSCLIGWSHFILGMGVYPERGWWRIWMICWRRDRIVLTFGEFMYGTDEEGAV